MRILRKPGPRNGVNTKYTKGSKFGGVMSKYALHRFSFVHLRVLRGKE